TSGRKTRSWITLPSALHLVDVVDRDGAAVAEIDDEDGEADRRLARRHGQHEHREDLADEIAEIGREGDEVDVHREQEQLDRHQDDDDVLAIDDHPQHAEREEDRADDEIMAEPDRHWICTPSPTAGLVLRVASCGRRATWREIFWPRTPVRARWVSTIAPII